MHSDLMAQGTRTFLFLNNFLTILKNKYKITKIVRIFENQWFVYVCKKIVKYFKIIKFDLHSTDSKEYQSLALKILSDSVSDEMRVLKLLIVKLQTIEYVTYSYSVKQRNRNHGRL